MTPLLLMPYVYDITPQYQATLNNERFLFCNKILCNKRLILFGTDQQLTFSFSAKHIMMDGTFDAYPPYFNQVYTAHAIKHEKDKRNFLAKISSLVNDTNPQRHEFLTHFLLTLFKTIHVLSVYYIIIKSAFTENYFVNYNIMLIN